MITTVLDDVSDKVYLIPKKKIQARNGYEATRGRVLFLTLQDRENSLFP
jgi:hypothetical protein